LTKPCFSLRAGAKVPATVSGQVVKKLWLTLEELFSGGRHFVTAKVYALDEVRDVCTT
jgi:hypothetical protein